MAGEAADKQYVWYGNYAESAGRTHWMPDWNASGKPGEQ